MDKMIEEMALDIMRVSSLPLEISGAIATDLAEIGYRKQVEKAKQEVAREILDEFECHISTGIRILKDCINDTDTDQVKRHLLGRLHELCGMEKFIDELRKKYIGE